MAGHILAVITNPTTPQQEAEFNRWYDEVHLADVLSVDGFVAAQRFKLAHDAAMPSPGPYLAIYEMETDNPQDALALLTTMANEGGIEISPAMHPEKVVASIFTPIGERVEA